MFIDVFRSGEIANERVPDKDAGKWNFQVEDTFQFQKR